MRRLFSDTSQGARASAICYSLIETAKLNRIEPSAYIEYILNQIGTADTLEKIEALLPWNVPLEKSSQTDTRYPRGEVGRFKLAYVWMKRSSFQLVSEKMCGH